SINGPAPAVASSLQQLRTPRAAVAAGIIFALLFGLTLILIRVKMPEGVGDSAEWLSSDKGGIRAATKLMPFAASLSYGSSPSCGIASDVTRIGFSQPCSWAAACCSWR